MNNHFNVIVNERQLQGLLEDADLEGEEIRIGLNDRTEVVGVPTNTQSSSVDVLAPTTVRFSHIATIDFT